MKSVGFYGVLAVLSVFSAAQSPSKTFAQATSAKADSAPQQHGSSDLLGSWAFELPDGNPAWLRVEQAKPGEFEAELLWSVGSARRVEQLEVWENRLRFVRRLRWQPFGRSEDARAIDEPFEGELIEGQLQLQFTQYPPSNPSQTETLRMGGKRMPPLPAKPDLSRVRFGQPIPLFNGRDLTGWRLANPDKKNGWRVEDGVLVNETPKKDFGAYGDYGNLVSEGEFEDFRLTIEYNVEAGGNSGIYLRGMYEAQVVDRDSRMQGIQGPGAIFGRLAPSLNAGKPGGEWNRYVLTLVSRHVSVELNGQQVIDNEALLGCTGGGLSADDTQPGPILLQGDHTSVRYRNIQLEPVLSHSSH